MNFTLQNLALQWRDKGLSPIPLALGGKVPTIRWKQYQDALPALPLVEWWFRQPVNMGLVLRGRWMVVDFDNVGSFMRFSQKNQYLAETYTVQTGRGFHCYYICDDKPTATTAFHGGDLKTSGYVVAVPSVHPSGKEYSVWKNLDPLYIGSWEELGLRGIQTKCQRSRSVMVGDSPIARIRNRLKPIDLLAQMTEIYPRRDGRWMARCPFHNDKNPSMIVDEEHAWCFRPDCIGHQQMDAINIYAIQNSVPIREAISILLDIV